MTDFSFWENGKLKEYGVLDSKVKENLPLERMREMCFLIKDLIEEYKPEYVAIEGTQFQRNFNTYNQLSQLQGIVFALLFELNLGFEIVQPSAWKAEFGVKGKSRAEQKLSAIQIVKEKYNKDVSEDEADAIGLGEYVIKNKNQGS